MASCILQIANLLLSNTHVEVDIALTSFNAFRLECAFVELVGAAGIAVFQPHPCYELEGAGIGLHFKQALAQLFCQDRKSTRLNSSHVAISYAVFCLKKKIQNEEQ